MIDRNQLRTLVIRPVLKYLDLWSPAAENLLMGTCAQESAFGTALKQYGSGPAVGIFQMEPATHDDIWKNFLSSQPLLSRRIGDMELPRWYEEHNADEMVGNLYYATAMARVFYRRVREPLPEANDIYALGRYYKTYYNTPRGAATVDQFVNNYRKYVGVS